MRKKPQRKKERKKESRRTRAKEIVILRPLAIKCTRNSLQYCWAIVVAEKRKNQMFVRISSLCWSLSVFDQSLTVVEINVIALRMMRHRDDRFVMIRMNEWKNKWATKATNKVLRTCFAEPNQNHHIKFLWFSWVSLYFILSLFVCLCVSYGFVTTMWHLPSKYFEQLSTWLWCVCTLHCMNAIAHLTSTRTFIWHSAAWFLLAL